MTDHRPTTEQALKEITAALDALAATITAALDNIATVEAPAPTLAEELRRISTEYDTEGYPEPSEDFIALATRAGQVEQERDEARAELERLKREQDRLGAQVQGLTRLDGDRNSEMRMLTGERNEALIEVERLTDERDAETVAPGENVAADQQANTQGILACSLPDPADVKPGEAWEVIATDPGKRFGGTTSYNTVAFRMADRWIVSRQGYPMPLVVTDDCIRLVRRHVPTPRVITDADGLDRAKRRTVIRDAAGVVCERDVMGDDWSTFASLTNQKPHIALPATVLWEPGA